MAVGYEKLNTSGARAKRRTQREIPRDQITVTPAGVAIWDATYGNGNTMEAFVSDCDKVKCEFASGYVVTLRGGSVRCGIDSANRKAANK
jgi:hypothetical protein